MGGGFYSSSDFTHRTQAMGYHKKSVKEVFTESRINKEMNPYGVKVRESRDSEEHPESLAIIIALDVTGSMGDIPHFLITEGLNHVMDKVMEKGIKDPQVLFLGIGDHLCDDAPLQVGQFESSDELLEKWLSKVFIEQGGGGNGGESYPLAWYFAANHTSIDCFEKRGQKGLLFTIGDEDFHHSLSIEVQNRYGRPKTIKDIMGPGEYGKYFAEDLFNRVKEKYIPFHLHLKQGHNGNERCVMDSWRVLVGENLIIVDEVKEIANTIANLIIQNYKPASPSVPLLESTEEEMML